MRVRRWSFGAKAGTPAATSTSCWTGEERLDLFDVLANMAQTWDRWTREAKELRALRQEQTDHEREVWERRKDRHFSAHPDHQIDFDERFAHRLKTGGISFPRDSCRECDNILRRYSSRWYPSQRATGGEHERIDR